MRCPAATCRGRGGPREAAPTAPNILYYGDNLDILRRRVASATMRDLIGTLDREKAELGLLVTLEPPTGPMRTEAVQAGFYHSPGWERDYPRVQILTVADLLAGRKPDLPPGRITFARADRIAAPTHQQATFALAGDGRPARDDD